MSHTNPILWTGRGLLVPRGLVPRDWYGLGRRPRNPLSADDHERIALATGFPLYGPGGGWRRRRYALPDYFPVEHGTAVIWGEAGAAGVTDTLTLDALADGSARMGAVEDMGAVWYEEQLALFVVETGTAPTAGNTAELYLASTYSTSFYPGGVTGSDAAWPSDGNEDEWRKQLGSPAVILVATNDGNTVQIQQSSIWRAAGRYAVPVVDNNLGQAFRDEATATNNDSRVILVPRRSLVQDAA